MAGRPPDAFGDWGNGDPGRAKGVDQPVVVDAAGQQQLLPAGLASDRAGGGVVLAGSGIGVAAGVIAELGKHPGGEDLAKAGLATVDLSVPVPAKMRLDLLLHASDLGIEVARIATRARTVAA